MTTSRKATRRELKNWMQVEEPGRALLYDIDKGLIDDIAARFSVKALVEEVKGKDAEAAKAAFAATGRDLMEATIELVDGKYMDRTGEMIKRTSKQTGLTFPSEEQRYIELSLLGFRPFDRLNVNEGTIKGLSIQIQSCSVHKALQDGGVAGADEVPCQAMCLASFATAAEKLGDRVSLEARKTLPKDGMCEFRLSK